MQRLRVLFFFIVLPLVLNAAYEPYCNARFNFCVDVDSNWGKEPAPTNNDGRSFFDHNGLKVSAYGSYNALMQTLRQNMQEHLSSLDEVTYQVIRANWFVVSGYKGSEIYYIKVFYENETFYTLYIHYPIQYKDEYNRVVSRLSKTFRVAKP